LIQGLIRSGCSRERHVQRSPSARERRPGAGAPGSRVCQVPRDRAAWNRTGRAEWQQRISRRSTHACGETLGLRRPYAEFNDGGYAGGACEALKRAVGDAFSSASWEALTLSFLRSTEKIVRVEITAVESASVTRWHRCRATVTGGRLDRPPPKRVRREETPPAGCRAEGKASRHREGDRRQIEAGTVRVDGGRMTPFGHFKSRSTQLKAEGRMTVPPISRVNGDRYGPRRVPDARRLARSGGPEKKA